MVGSPRSRARPRPSGEEGACVTLVWLKLKTPAFYRSALRDPIHRATRAADTTGSTPAGNA